MDATPTRVSALRLGWTLLRCRLHFIRAIQRLFARASNWTLQVVFPGIEIFISAEPRLAHEVLVERAAECSKTRWERRVLEPAMEDGLIILEGEPWKERRQASAACFGAPGMVQLVTIISGAVRARIARWKPEVNLHREMRCVVNESMFRFFLNGRSIQAKGPATECKYARAFERVERGLESRVFDFLFIGERLRSLLLPGQSFRSSLALVTRSIDERVADPGEPEHAGSPLHSLLARIPARLSVSREIRTMLGAGSTGVHLLTWIGHLLATHPEAQERLRAEILASLGGRGELTLSGIEALPFLSAVIQEGLRLYPPAPYLIRKRERAGRDGRSALYLFSVWAMHRSPAHWSEADEFRPERWLDSAGGLSTVSSEAFIPFGLGPRVCIGKRFAMTEARVVLIEILRRYRLEPICGARAPAPVFTVLTRPGRPVRLRATPI